MLFPAFLEANIYYYHLFIYFFYFWKQNKRLSPLGSHFILAVLEKQAIYFARRFYHFSPQTAHDAWWKIIIEVYGIWFWTQLGFACLSSLIDLRIILRCFSPCLSFSIAKSLSESCFLGGLIEWP